MRTTITGQDAVNQSIKAINTTLYGTSGARALARVLLHAYNAAKQPLDITELCSLDDEHEEWAWAILKLQVDGTEPHHFVKDKKGFQVIVDDYWVQVDAANT